MGYWLTRCGAVSATIICDYPSSFVTYFRDTTGSSDCFRGCPNEEQYELLMTPNRSSSPKEWNPSCSDVASTISWHQPLTSTCWRSAFGCLISLTLAAPAPAWRPVDFLLISGWLYPTSKYSLTCEAMVLIGPRRDGSFKRDINPGVPSTNHSLLRGNLLASHEVNFWGVLWRPLWWLTDVHLVSQKWQDSHCWDVWLNDYYIHVLWQIKMLNH